MSEPVRARAMFSTQDFRLMREALLFYLRQHHDQPEAGKASHLYHRLGAMARD